MKNYLIITLGTREIQLLKSAIEPNGFEIITEIRKEAPFTFVQPVSQPNLRVSARGSDDFQEFYTISPRTDGELILANWSVFRSIVDWPLIRPAIQHLKGKAISIDIVMLVFTDQEEAYKNGRVKKKSYINNDTVFFAEMIERLIREDAYFDATEIDKFGRFESVADMAVQYDEFRKIKDDLISDDEVGKVYLFPQGGIDQINQALTLRLIETFEGRVVYLQNAEGQEVQELDFPRRFVSVLTKQKVLKHLNDFDFGYIDKSLYQDKLVCHLAQYATRRLNMQHNQLKVNTDVLLYDERIANLRPELERNMNTDEQKLTDLYLAAKVSYHQKKYADFLWRLFSLGENLFKVQIEKVVGPVDKYRMTFTQLKQNNGKNTAWEKCLNAVDNQLLQDLNQMRNYKGYPIAVDNPNRWAFQALYLLLHQRGLIAHDANLLAIFITVGNAIEELASSRNDIAHKLGSVSLNDINQSLTAFQKGYLTNQLFTDLDQIFNITGFGIYDTIRDEIKDLL